MKAILETCIKELFDIDVDVTIDRPDPKFGDFASNVALQLAGQLGKNPREIAEMVGAKLRENADFSEVTIAGPGFINVRLNDKVLIEMLDKQAEKTYDGKSIVVEYSDPNPFKVLHAGHLYTSVVGDAIANLFEHAGARVHRVNFGGDVGLHVGKTMWAILKELGGENPDGLQNIPADQHSEWMAKCYVEGTNAYEDDEAAKAEIIEVNKRVYQVHADNDHDSAFAQIYWTCRGWSYDYFNAFYDRIGTHFEKYFPESETAPLGLKTVKEQLEKGVFSTSDGAVVFEGEPHGLHTRVFINSAGLPTYEAKDVGLSLMKWDEYQPDESVIITANDIVEYMKVVLKAIEQFKPELANITRHLTHGNVKLSGGAKMSSRKGNFLRAVDVLDEAKEAAKNISDTTTDSTVLAAVKYAFLKSRMGGDIIYEPQESVSLEGNSGPYLQYAHARAVSILTKSQIQPGDLTNAQLDENERLLVAKLSQEHEVIAKATDEMMPHHVCTYLYELAQEFNRFYEKSRIIGDEREAVRLSLVRHYVDTLKNGLSLLGIAAPDTM